MPQFRTLLPPELGSTVLLDISALTTSSGNFEGSEVRPDFGIFFRLNPNQRRSADS